MARIHMQPSTDSQHTPGRASALSQLLGPLRPVPWVGLASTLFCGFVATASLLRVAPRPPWGIVLLLAALAALLLRRTVWAVMASVVLGSAAFVFVSFVYPSARQDVVDYMAIPAGVVLVLGIGLVFRRVNFRILSYAVALLLCAIFLLQAHNQAETVERYVAREPPAESYNYDPVFFMKTFWLVEKHDMGFYEAWGQASQADARFEQPTTNLAGWRTPVATRLWTTLFDSGTGILLGYVLGATLALLLAYALAARLSDPATALLVPIVLIPFYLSAITTYQYLSYETWGGFFAIAAAFFVAHRLERAGLAFSFGAAILREWFVSALLGGIIMQLWRRRWREACRWGVALGLTFLVWGLNIWHARQYLRSAGVDTTLGASERFGVGGPGFLLHTLSYNSQGYALTHVVPLVVFFFGLAGVAALLIRKQPFVPSLILVPVAIFLVSGSAGYPGGPYTGACYGGAFIPFIAVATCCVSLFFARLRTKEDAFSAGVRRSLPFDVAQPKPHLAEQVGRAIGKMFRRRQD